MNVRLTEVYTSMYASCPHCMGESAHLAQVVVVYKLLLILDKYH